MFQKCPKKRKPHNNKVTGFFQIVVGLLGLEPRKTAPKTVVLPLHHRPILIRVQIYNIFSMLQTNSEKK